MYYCILTGGKSRRMGADKALLKFGDKFLVELLAERFLAAGNVCISSADGRLWQDLPGRSMCLGGNIREVGDLISDIGPLGGIYSLLEVLRTDIFVMATDMPFADVRLADLIVDAGKGEKLCLLERADGRLEPLFGYYSAACLGPVKQMIAQHHYRLSDLAGRVASRTIRENELADLYGSGCGEVLFNMNTPVDYEEALNIFKLYSNIKK